MNKKGKKNTTKKQNKTNKQTKNRKEQEEAEANVKGWELHDFALHLSQALSN